MNTPAHCIRLLAVTATYLEASWPLRLRIVLHRLILALPMIASGRQSARRAAGDPLGRWHLRNPPLASAGFLNVAQGGSMKTVYDNSQRQLPAGALPPEKPRILNDSSQVGHFSSGSQTLNTL